MLLAGWLINVYKECKLNNSVSRVTAYLVGQKIVLCGNLICLLCFGFRCLCMSSFSSSLLKNRFSGLITGKSVN